MGGILKGKVEFLSHFIDPKDYLLILSLILIWKINICPLNEKHNRKRKI